MRALLQRVSQARVVVGGDTVGEIERGVLIFLGIEVGDTQKEIDLAVTKITGMRIFSDDEGKMNLSCEDIGGSFLAVSQFTLCADTRKGKRPSYVNAMKPPQSEDIYGRFCDALAQSSARSVERGVFGAHMEVELINDGPVTIWLDFPPTTADRT